MIRVKEAAGRLGVHPDTLKRLERHAALHPCRDRAGHRRYSDAEIERLRAILYPPVRPTEPEPT